MEESDIKEIINILKDSLKLDDWTLVEDAIDYLSDFCETESSDIDENEE